MTKEKVLITDIDDYGRGIGKINNKITFINHALPLDIVNIKLTKEKKSYNEGEIITYIKKSPLRTETMCPYQNICNCTLAPLDYKKQLEYKKNKLIHIFSHIANTNIKINKIIPSKIKSYRNKATFHIKNKKIGYYKTNTNQLIEINQCPILHPILNNFIQENQKELINNNEDFTIKTNGKNIMFEANKINNALALKLTRQKITSIYQKDTLIYGTKYITYNLLNNKFNIRNKSFFQVNLDVFEQTLKLIIKYVQDKEINNLLDLYCGVGVIGISLSNYINNITGIEIVKEAVKDANNNKKANNKKNINFIQASVNNEINNYKDIDTIIIDPPRSGLNKNIIKQIIRINPQYIIYLSCNQTTLARDYNTLKEKYIIEEINMMDMFANTYHIEVLCFLKRK